MPQPLDPQAVQAALARLPHWSLTDDGRAISRSLRCQGYIPARMMAAAAADLAERMNHHPEITFGWGHCTVSYSSHDAGGVTQRDLDAAMALDGMLDDPD